MTNGHLSVAAMLRENWFWAGVFRDHADFIYSNLAPGQERQIQWAQSFKQSFTTLHAEARQAAETASLQGPAGSYAVAGVPQEAPLSGLQGQELLQLERQAGQLSRSLLASLQSLKGYKEELLGQKLECSVQLGLGPTLLAHMIVEAEEAQRTVSQAGSLADLPPALQALHHHLVWLPDAAGHAAALHGGADGIERQVLRTTQQFKDAFDGLQIRSLELYSMLRIAPRMVGALKRLNRDSMAQIGTFRAFLLELREHLEDCEILGSLVPLLADHMLREELYYTEKIMLVNGAP